VEALLAAEPGHDMESLVGQAVRANVRASVDHLRHGSEILEQLIQKEGLLVVGGEYSLETGVVDSSTVHDLGRRAEVHERQIHLGRGRGVLFIIVVTTLVDILLHVTHVFPPMNQPIW